MKHATVGIMSLEVFKARTIAIAKGEYHPKPNEPKIWFSSIKSAASVGSIAELEQLTGPKPATCPEH